MLEERGLVLGSVVPARNAMRQAYDAELRGLVADARARLGATVACLSRHVLGEQRQEILATDTVDRLALTRLPDLVGSAARRLRDDMGNSLRLSAHGPLLRMMFPVEGSDVLLLLMQRPIGSGWSDDELEAAQSFHAELHRYLRLWWQHRLLLRRRDGLHAALDLQDVGALVLDGDGSLIFANRSGRDLLDAKDGLRLFGASVTATRVEDAVRLQTALLHAIGQGDEGSRQQQARRAPVTLIQRKESMRPLIAAVMRIAGPFAERRDPAAVIYLIDPERGTQGMIEPACRVYGLTGAEVRLGAKLLQGMTLAEAARHLRIKPLTAKAYLKQIFAKTGVHRQADLVRVLLGSMIRTSAPVEVTIL